MATLKDISNKVGVSIRTVNRALKDNGYVKPEVKEKVLAAARELGYRPNRIARALKTKSSYEILVLMGSTEELQVEVISGIEKRLRRESYLTSLLMAPQPAPNADEHIFYSEIVNEIAIRRPAGIVLFSSTGILTREILTYIIKNDVPYIIIGEDSGFDTVIIDRQQGIYDAVKYLANEGSEKIAYLAYHCVKDKCNQTRLSGYYRAMAELSLKPLIFESKKNLAQFEGGRDVAGKITENKPASDAILCYTDAMAMGLLTGFNELNIKVPSQIKVVGFDGRKAGEWASPPLTTVDQPNVDVGMTAAEIILDKIKGKKAPDEGWSKMLPTRLVIRESA